MPEDIFDVAIVGAGPAGAMAATILARNDRRVLLLDREAFPRSVPCSGWVSARVGDLLAGAGIKNPKLLSKPFHLVSIHNADFTKRSEPKFERPPGFLVDRTEFDNELVKSAMKLDVEFRPERDVSNIELRESSVRLQTQDDEVFQARLLILAAGRGTPLLEMVGLPRESPGLTMWTAQVSQSTGRSLKISQPHVAIVLGLDGGGSFGLCCLSPDRITIDVNWLGEREGVVGALTGLCRLAHKNHVVPVDLSDQAAGARIVRTPASAALDMDSHVRKHTLIVGDAGGFVSAVSNEGIYPAMWSARIAAEVVNEALESKHSQDALMQFDSKWRIEIADHLRSPHTDIRFLLPLIFTNQPMADRMAAAFFFGENI